MTKDSLMRHDLNSPLPAGDKKHFLSLSYFEPKEEYKVTGKYEPLDTPEIVVMKFSAGDHEEFYRMGTIRFELLDGKCSLVAFQTHLQKKDVSLSNILFIPFGDLTNGKETFEGGRYLYVKPSKGNVIEIDFNDAANPNCAYNPLKSCPMPPVENMLHFRIEAGEKKY